jgi:hemerythrin
MIGFAWSEEMSVGVPALDADYRGIIRIINMLQGADKENAGKFADAALDRLVAYCDCHFAREEQVMIRCGFPGLEFHRGEHEGFTRFVSGLRERYTRQADTSIIDELHDYLTRWLCHHILIQDMAYKPYVLAAADANLLPDLPMPPGDQDSRNRTALSP